MYIKKASIQGPCKGVIEAINKVNKLLDNPTVTKPIYMLGRLVHNEFVSQAYVQKGIIILEGNDKLSLLKNITSGTVIITAHGVSRKVYEYLNNHKIDYLDTTCSYVRKSKDLIKNYLDKNYNVLYLGTNNHPEVEAIIENYPQVILIDYKKAINEEICNYQFNNSDKFVLTCQTTLSFMDVQKVYEKLKSIYPNITLASEVCSATRLRQSALIRECKDFSLCLVVGDKFSNNTKSLKDVCIKYNNIPCELVEDINDCANINFKNHDRIFITSGASTPKVIVDEIVHILENDLPYKSNITLDSYIKNK